MKNWLAAAKMILDQDSHLMIDGCKAAINNALRCLDDNEDERISDNE